MNEYDEYDYCDDIPHVGACPRRKPSRYDLDTMTPAEIEAYEYYEFNKFND